MASYPLFPLDVVLFPGALLPLHIFEPRYRSMLADCAAGAHRFVVLPPGEGGTAPAAGTVGTVARIRAIQPLPDGRSNVVVSGEDRVSLAAIEPTDQPYLTGRCEVLTDDPDTQVPTGDELVRVRQLAERYATALGNIAEVERQPDLADEAAPLGFQVAALLEWDFPTKQQFLGIRSPYERIARLLQALPALLADLEARAEVHRRAPTNGKGRH
ncbi:MAG: LON peptidase substrate-binding domain-containing protein [Gemmatimonadales bacterium]